MALDQDVSLIYDVQAGGLSLERDNLNRPLILREFESWKFKDKLNKINEFTAIVFKRNINLNDIYFEREVLIPAFEFEGIITAVVDNNDNTLEITIKERAWHFTRRIYKIEDLLKEYNIKLVDPASLPDFLQLIISSANEDMPLISATSISNLVSHFIFEGDVLDQFASNDGTVTGTTTFVPGKVGAQAFSFDDATRINLANESNFDREVNQPFSISFWIKLDAAQTGQGMVIGKRTNLGATDVGYSVTRTAVDQMRFEMANGTNEFGVNSAVLAVDRWYHVVCTYEGLSNKDGMKIYLDGILDATGATESIPTSILNALTLSIGGANTGARDLFAIVDIVRFYNKELTAAEVNSISRENVNSSNPVERREIFELGEDIPATSDFDFDVKWKTYYDVLRLVARNSLNDVWFEHKTLLFGRKGKTINLDRDEKLYNKLESKIDLDIFGNIIHVVGAKVAGVNVHATASNTDIDLKYNYERVVSNNNLTNQAAVDGVVNRVLDEFDSVTPDVDIDIMQSVIHKYNMKSGDVIKINTNTETQNVKGFFRIIDLTLSSGRNRLKLQFSKDGKFLPRISDSFDILQAALIKIHDLELNS